MKTFKTTTVALFLAGSAAGAAFTATSATSPTYSEAPTPVPIAAAAPAVNPAASYGKLPISFEPNRGQAAGEAKFLARGQGYSMALTEQGATMMLRKGGKDATASAQIRFTLLDGQAHPQLTPEDQQAGVSNYLIGKDSSKWKTNLPNYSAVRYTAVYPGIDWKVYGNPQRFEHDFIVAANADATKIRMKVEGADRLSLDANGDLLVAVQDSTLRQLAPVIYQTAASGAQQRVEGHYVLDAAKRQFAFALGDYDHSRELVIDPGFVYSTYLGGSDSDNASGIAVDSAGNAYVTGGTVSVDFPTANPLPTGGSINRGASGQFVPADAFVTKLNANGTARVYSTYLGGSNNERATAIAVDGNGSAHVTGFTFSTDFPTTSGSAQPAINSSGSGDAFVAKLNATGDGLVFSTYLGGSSEEFPRGIAVGAFGYVYVDGSTFSNDFPITAHAQQPGFGGYRDAFITQLLPDGSAFNYSSFLGGSRDEFVNAIAVSGNFNVYVTGYTESPNFPTVQPIKATLGGAVRNAFVSAVAIDVFQGTGTLFYSSYLGGSSVDEGTGIAVGPFGAIYVAGTTQSSDFPIVNPTQGAFTGVRGNSFVSKLNPLGSGSGIPIFYSTFLGGSTGTVVNAIAVDGNDSAYVTGRTFDSDFPVLNAVQPIFGNGNGDIDAFVTKFSPSGGTLVYSTYLGGSSSETGYAFAVDNAGNAYVAGETASSNFPTANATQRTYAGNYDAFVAKISDVLPVVTLSFSNSSFAEAGGGIDVIANLSQPATAKVMVRLRFSGAAARKTRYSTSSHTINIPAGGLTGSIRLTGIDDATYEGQQSVTVTTASATNASVPMGNVITAYITDDEAPPTVNLRLSSGKIPENGGAATLTAELSGPSAYAINVEFSHGGTATLGSDYSLSSNTIVIPAGSLRGSLVITGLDDALAEPEETVTGFISSLTSPNGPFPAALPGTVTSGTLKIISDE